MNSVDNKAQVNIVDKLTKQLLIKPKGVVKQKDVRKAPILRKVQQKVFDNREKFIKKFKEFSKKYSNVRVQPKDGKFDTFLNSISNPTTKKVWAQLPRVLLTLTILALKNKAVFKTIISAYTVASVSFDKQSTLGKAFTVIKVYGELLEKMNAFERLDQVFTLLVLFAEDIPSLVKSIHRIYDYSDTKLVVLKNIFRNANQLNNEIIYDKVPRNKQKVSDKVKEIVEKISK